MKKVFSMILVFVIVMTVFFSFPISVYSESLYIRKIVSVVYDDSGSMYGDKWAYANYAMQSFCGMLNSEDQLYITYMNKAVKKSNYQPEQIDLSAGGIQNSVNSIKNHKDSDSTPYKAVEIAYNKLKSVKDSNPNTQYWLVVITDGDFNECMGYTTEQKERFINEKFAGYTKDVMPNGTKSQFTFLGIEGVATPKEDANKGIFTYKASNAGGITKAMSEMADKISGRTRLDKSDITKIDDRTLQISSSIPLLNIAVFAQKSNAKITKAVYSNEKDIPVSRSVSLSYPGYSDLRGGAFLIGDSTNVIGSGTYKISFDQNINTEDVVVLFEPALETRMKITVNGKEISSISDLDNVMEKDKISVSYKIYEMGTDKEISPTLLPPGTKFEISVLEDGKVVKQNLGQDMSLSDYVLKNIDTRIVAKVVIDGFNPIEYSVNFKPLKYVPKIVYTIQPSFGSAVKSVKIDDIANNKDLTICFTIFADGVAMTDASAVKALNPVISLSPQGNDGEVSFSDDGKIIFTPKVASMTTNDDGGYVVDVVCTINDGTSANEKYNVLLATYEVVPLDADSTIKKTELYKNQVSVSFYITKDGVKLDKETVEKQISVLLNKEHSKLKTNVVIAPDGTITVTPYSEDDHVLTFWNWWVNWAYYFGLEGEDIKVTLSHSFGSATAAIDIVEEDILYLILKVYLPLIIEIALILWFVWWAYAIIAKPKFDSNAVIYYGYITHGGKAGNRNHEISTINELHLKQYNKLKYIWKPTLNTKVVYFNDVGISAGPGGSIICHSELWYKDNITPKNLQYTFEHPHNLKQHIDDYNGLLIEVINPYEEQVHAVETIDSPHPDIYYVHTDLSNMTIVDGIQTIENGTIFAYAYRLEE